MDVLLGLRDSALHGRDERQWGNLCLLRSRFGCGWALRGTHASLKFTGLQARPSYSDCFFCDECSCCAQVSPPLGPASPPHGPTLTGASRSEERNAHAVLKFLLLSALLLLLTAPEFRPRHVKDQGKPYKSKAPLSMEIGVQRFAVMLPKTEQNVREGVQGDIRPGKRGVRNDVKTRRTGTICYPWQTSIVVCHGFAQSSPPT